MRVPVVMNLWHVLQDLAGILYRAAGDGNVDPHKVEQILGVPPTSSKRKRLAEEISGGFIQRCSI